MALQSCQTGPIQSLLLQHGRVELEYLVKLRSPRVLWPQFCVSILFHGVGADSRHSGLALQLDSEGFEPRWKGGG